MFLKTGKTTPFGKDTVKVIKTTQTDYVWQWKVDKNHLLEIILPPRGENGILLT